MKLSLFSIPPVRPLHVEILFNNQPLSADRQYEIECEAIGSRPPSVITWWMNGVALVAQPSKVSAAAASQRLSTTLNPLKKLIHSLPLVLNNPPDKHGRQHNNVNVTFYAHSTRQWEEFSL